MKQIFKKIDDNRPIYDENGKKIIYPEDRLGNKILIFILWIFVIFLIIFVITIFTLVIPTAIYN